jgi:type VI protein secretion system component Hcp
MRSKARLATAAIVGALAAAVAFMLTGAGAAPQAQAQAAPVLAAQAPCPQSDPRPVSRSTVAFAHIDGIQGDATAVGHAGDIDVTTIHAGLLAGLSGLCGAGTRTAFNPIVFEKPVDRASVPLTANAITGRHIRTASIGVFTAGGTRPVQLLKYDLSDVVVFSVRQVQHGDSLTEEVALGFGRIAYEFTQIRPDGTPGAVIRFCWDIAANRAC